MTLHQFNFLDTNEQSEVITKQAVYIAERTDGAYTYKLYKMDKFYIEEQWHTKLNDRRHFISFIDEEKLKPYLDKIDLKELDLSPG